MWSLKGLLTRRTEDCTVRIDVFIPESSKKWYKKTNKLEILGS